MLLRCQLRNNSLQHVVLQSSTSKIEHCNFTGGDQTIHNLIYATQSFFVINACNFSNLVTTGVGAGLMLENVQQNLIQNCIFSGLQAEQGGALAISSSLSFQDVNQVIDNNQFLYNKAREGAAMFIQNVNYLNLSGNAFYHNVAELTTTAGTLGSGGGMYYACDTTSYNCTVRLQSPHEFGNNSAYADGGGVFWANVQPENLVSMFQASASLPNSAVYGPNYACYGSRIVWNSGTSRRLVHSGREMTGTVNASWASGQQLVFNISMTDVYGQIVTTDNKSKIAVKANNTATTSLTNFEGVASSGIIYIGNLTVTATPGTQVALWLEITPGSTFGNTFNFAASSSTNIDFSSRECTAGE